jgi:hypothetical protein
MCSALTLEREEHKNKKESSNFKDKFVTVTTKHFISFPTFLHSTLIFHVYQICISITLDVAISHVLTALSMLNAI